MGPSRIAAMKRDLSKKAKKDDLAPGHDGDQSKVPKLDDPSLSVRSTVEGGVPATKAPVTVDPPINSKQEDPLPARAADAQDALETNNQKPSGSNSRGSPVVWHGITLPACYAGLKIDQLSFPPKKRPAQTIWTYCTSLQPSFVRFSRNQATSNPSMRSKIVRATINDSATQDQVYTAARFTAVGSNPTLNFEVRPDPAVPLYQINGLRNPAITDNGQFSPKKAADLLVSKGHFGHQMAQAAGAMFSDHFVRNDNSLLYYKGFILLTFLRDAEEAALVPNVVGVVGNVLVVNVQDVADFPILVTGIQSGALTVGATAFTDDELNILATIMRGFPVYQMPAAGQNRATYMLNQVAAPGLTLMILAPFHQPNPVIDVCSSHRMLALLLKLATVRGEEEDLVRGFTRASTLVNGRCRRMTNLAAPRAIVTTTAEIGAVSVPLVADCNALLWILDPPIVTNDEFSADFLAIASASTEELVLSSIAVGCAIGVCTSTIFLSYNIRGQQLNGAMGGPGQNSAMATAYIRDNAIAPSGAPLCRLWGRIAGSFLSYCSWVVSPTCFYGRGWSCALTAFDIPAPNTAFARLFDNEAPFVVSALCILWAFDVYPLQWGIPMRGTSIDSSSMVVQATADGFSPLAGCPELLERAINTRNRAWRSSYPGLVINLDYVATVEQSCKIFLLFSITIENTKKPVF